MSNEARHFYAFGPFRLDSRERVLLRDGQVVPLTPKVAETLLVLVENAGNLVGKDNLIRRVWPDAFVEEGNLNKNIYTLRKLLGASADGREYIETAPKRGYRFVAQVERLYEGPGGPGAPAEPKLRATDEAHSPEVEVPPVGPLPWDQRSTSASDPVSHLQLPSGSAVRAPLLQMPSRTGAEPSSEAVGSRLIAVPPVAARRIPKKVVGLASSLLFVALAGIGTYLYLHSRSTPKLTDQDTLVVADFTNTTGDPVFDGALRHGLSVYLQQSPFLSLVSDARIANSLALMGQPRDARLTKDLAREVCQRTSSAATLKARSPASATSTLSGSKPSIAAMASCWPTNNRR